METDKGGSNMKCSDCNGTGKYVGFTATEACKACEGTGKITTLVIVDEAAGVPVGLPLPGTPWVEPDKATVSSCLDYIDRLNRYLNGRFPPISQKDCLINFLGYNAEQADVVLSQMRANADAANKAN